LRLLLDTASKHARRDFVAGCLVASAAAIDANFRAYKITKRFVDRYFPLCWRRCMKVDAGRISEQGVAFGEWRNSQARRGDRGETGGAAAGLSLNTRTVGNRRPEASASDFTPLLTDLAAIAAVSHRFGGTGVVRHRRNCRVSPLHHHAYCRSPDGVLCPAAA